MPKQSSKMLPGLGKKIEFVSLSSIEVSHNVLQSATMVSPMNIRQRFEKWMRWVRRTPERKRWFDVLTAMLTIPVLLTVIITNVMNLRSRDEKNASPVPSTTSAPIQITIENPQASNQGANVAVTPTPRVSVSPSGPSCKEGVADYEIISPRESEIVSNDPLCIVFSPKSKDFCEASWSYRINNASWSPYSDAPVCLYNMADGPVQFELRIKGNNGEEKTHTRNFIYRTLPESNTSNTPIPSPSQ